MDEELENTLATTEEEEEREIQYHILDDPGLVHYTEGLTQIFLTRKDLEKEVSDLNLDEYAKKAEVNQRFDEIEEQLKALIGIAQDLEELI